MTSRLLHILILLGGGLLLIDGRLLLRISLIAGILLLGRGVLLRVRAQIWICRIRLLLIEVHPLLRRNRHIAFEIAAQLQMLPSRNLNSVSLSLLADMQLLRLVYLQSGSGIASSRSRRGPRRRSPAESAAARSGPAAAAASRQVPRTPVAARARAPVRRVLLLVHARPFPLHVEIAALVHHFLLDDVGLREIRTTLKIRIRAGTAVIRLKLKVGIGRARIRSASRRIKRQPHLVLVLMLFGHLLQGLSGGTQLGLAEVHVAVGHPILRDRSLPFEDGRRVVLVLQ